MLIQTFLFIFPKKQKKNGTQTGTAFYRLTAAT